MIATVYEDDSLKIVDGNWFAGSSIRMAFYPTGKRGVLLLAVYLYGTVAPTKHI